VFREESISSTWVSEWKSPNSWRSRKARQVKSKVKDIEGTVYKEFVLAGQEANFA
jgi:hypothetical protein